MIENFGEPKGQVTESLLKSIANRLSGRADCKQVCYRVTINHLGVTMDPIVDVFPNRYKRREEDKMDVVSYIHEYKMPDVKLSDFVFGVYEYQLSIDNKKRRWRRVE